MNRDEIFNAIKLERELQDEKGYSDFDAESSQNDWVAYITAYLGRAASGVHRNKKEGQTFDANLIKAAALIVAALEAHAE